MTGTTAATMGEAPAPVAAHPAAAPPAVLAVAPAFRGIPPARLEEAVRARLAAWAGPLEGIAGIRVVKATRRRTVARFDSDAALPAVYVKQERILGILARLRSVAIRSHARLEFENAARLAALDVLAPPPVAYAEWRAGPFVARSLSVLGELEGGVRLDLWLASVPSERRFAVLGECARSLLRLHERNIDLTDCHRGNLLVMPGSGEGEVRLALLDVATVRFRPVRPSTRIARLGQLLHSLQDAIGYDERRAFVERYAREAGLTLTALDDFAREVRGAELRVHRIRERSRDRRCLVDSTEYWVRRGARARVFARRGSTPDGIAFFAGLGKSLDELEARGARVVKREGRNECFVVEREGVRRFAKRVAASSLGGALVDAFRGSRGRRAWKAAHALERRGLPTPRAVALVEEGFLVPLRSTLLVEEAPGARTLADVAREFPALFPRPRDRARFLEAFARLVAELHRCDVDHDDLALKNFLVELGDEPRFQVIDLEAVRGWHRPLPKERVLRALMQLDDAPRTVSRADRMRFLAAYERAEKTRFTREDLAEVRRLLRERFARSGRDYAATGPR